LQGGVAAVRQYPQARPAQVAVDGDRVLRPDYVAVAGHDEGGRGNAPQGGQRNTGLKNVEAKDLPVVAALGVAEYGVPVLLIASLLLRGYLKQNGGYTLFRSLGSDTDERPFSKVLTRIGQ
jgi:hypothetical protein